MSKHWISRTDRQCKKAFRKDMTAYEEADEYCPHCDNQYVRLQVPIVLQADVCIGNSSKGAAGYDRSRGRRRKNGFAVCHRSSEMESLADLAFSPASIAHPLFRCSPFSSPSLKLRLQDDQGRPRKDET
jgi:hypothetical protein